VSCKPKNPSGNESVSDCATNRASVVRGLRGDNDSQIARNGGHDFKNSVLLTGGTEVDMEEGVGSIATKVGTGFVH
jgi:hypothetical protein